MLQELFVTTALASSALSMPSVPGEDEHGKLPWFEGSFQELIAKATAEDKIIFLDFWTDWCGWCKRLDMDTFSDDGVVSAMSNMLCFSVDAESEWGIPIAKRYAVTGFPTLAVLESDGSLRDRWSGYLPPEPFIAEIQRVERNEGTLSALESGIAADPANLEMRLAYGKKLRDMQNQAGYLEQIAAIKRLDPEGKHIASRHLRLDELRTQAGTDLKTTGLLKFLEHESDAELQFEGHEFITRVCAYRLRSESGSAADELRRQLVQSLSVAWKHHPVSKTVYFGSGLVRVLWTQREKLADDAKEFALQVAREVAQLAPEDAGVQDTLGCALFMNGDVEGAVAAAQRSIELAPGKPEYVEHLELFRNAL